MEVRNAEFTLTFHCMEKGKGRGGFCAGWRQGRGCYAARGDGGDVALAGGLCVWVGNAVLGVAALAVSLHQ